MKTPSLKQAQTYYQRMTKIQDSAFNVEELGQYQLCLTIGPKEFYFAVINTNNNRCLSLEHFSFQKVGSMERLTNFMKEIIEDHHYLSAGFWKEIFVCVKNQRFSLVPNSLFDEAHLTDYLNWQCEIDEEKDAFFYHQHPALGLVTTFATSKKLVKAIEEFYPNKKPIILHQTSPLLEGALQAFEPSLPLKMHLHCSGSFLNIVILRKGGQLQYNNVFTYKTPEDLLYFTMLVIKELELNPETLPVSVSGDIDFSDMNFTKLYQYIRALSFSTRPTHLHFGYMFDEVFDHQFFDLLSLPLCK